MPTCYNVYADTPGMGPEDLHIELVNGVLTVGGVSLSMLMVTW
jgi:hypothetical protein